MSRGISHKRDKWLRNVNLGNLWLPWLATEEKSRRGSLALHIRSRARGPCSAGLHFVVPGRDLCRGGLYFFLAGLHVCSFGLHVYVVGLHVYVVGLHVFVRPNDVAAQVAVLSRRNQEWKLR